ncbi:hypothetical protein CLCR_06222 [Cladophialophora carrionii]|uniref:Extracellular membrane protein CFEM domain-containing protein n=1 Tax=Cladophialophora carrionii TaxID=86049 RepID=A0A1C1C7D8_9EURO|nr:hypothetical protein CLCR_06222 [Cladophialophora carrionii]
MPRGTCTDQAWLSDACPNFCLDQEALGSVMYSCNVTGVDEYCCNDGCSCDPSAGEEVVSFTGTPYKISVIGVTSTYVNPSMTGISSASSTSDSSALSPTPSPFSSSLPSNQSSSSAPSILDTAGPVASSSIPQTADPAISSSSPSVTSTASGSSSNGVAIGVGVGVGVGVEILLLAMGVFFLYRRRVRARKSGRTHTDKAAFNSSERPVDPPRPGNPGEYTPKEPFTASHNSSELSSAGHEYNEFGADGAQTELSARKSDVAELPGQ